jgi:hypothetical protein
MTLGYEKDGKLDVYKAKLQEGWSSLFEKLSRPSVFSQ